MKRFLLTLMTLLTLAAMAPQELGAQARLSTKKIKIGDFTSRTTKVVLKGNDMTDSALREEVTARWRISPFEFCTVDEFNALKKNPQYYFLMTDTPKGSRYEGLVTLSLFKGGLESSDDPSKVSIDIINIPLCSAKYPDGREVMYLSAILDIMQDFVSKAIQSDSQAYRGLDIYSGNVRKSGHKDIIFAEEDLAPETSRRLFDAEMKVMDCDDADEAFGNGLYNTLVSFTAAPSEARRGNWSYQMLIDAETHTLYYYSRHKITDSKWAGFTEKDIKKIAAPRKRFRK